MTIGSDFFALDPERVAAQRLSDFDRSETPDLLDKSRRLFFEWLEKFSALGVLQVVYRVSLEGPLDHRIRVRDPVTGSERELICFDSNSYLGLHVHPRILAATHRALDEMGYGTPSAQLLGGTNRLLLELEKRWHRFMIARPRSFILQDTKQTSGSSPACRAAGSLSISVGHRAC
jgi:hypothetical protein